MINFKAEKIVAFKSVCPLCGTEEIEEKQGHSTNSMKYHLQEHHKAKEEMITYDLVLGKTQDELDLQIERKKVIDLLSVVKTLRDKLGDVGNK